VNNLNRVLGIAFTILVGTFLTQNLVYASSGSDAKSHARHSRIVGLWDVSVEIADCNSGAIVGGFRAMHKYELGGTGQVVPSTSPTILSEHSMIWRHIRGDDYRMAVRFYRFDGSGNNVGWNIIRNDVWISRDGNSYSGTGYAEIYNLDGVVVGALCPSFTGTRFTLD
jgi:hypothetical protein